MDCSASIATISFMIAMAAYFSRARPNVARGGKRHGKDRI
jgi:hypothetical protein